MSELSSFKRWQQKFEGKPSVVIPPELQAMTYEKLVEKVKDLAVPERIEVMALLNETKSCCGNAKKAAVLRMWFANKENDNGT